VDKVEIAVRFGFVFPDIVNVQLVFSQQLNKAYTRAPIYCVQAIEHYHSVVFVEMPHLSISVPALKPTGFPNPPSKQMPTTKLMDG
jgi:hypothetical protein